MSSFYKSRRRCDFFIMETIESIDFAIEHTDFEVYFGSEYVKLIWRAVSAFFIPVKKYFNLPASLFVWGSEAWGFFPIIGAGTRWCPLARASSPF